MTITAKTSIMTITADDYGSKEEREFFSHFSKTISNNNLIVVGIWEDRDCETFPRPNTGDRGMCLAWAISGCDKEMTEAALQALDLAITGSNPDFILGQNAVWGIITNHDVTIETEFEDIEYQHYSHVEVKSALLDWLEIIKLSSNSQEKTGIDSI